MKLSLLGVVLGTMSALMMAFLYWVIQLPAYFLDFGAADDFEHMSIDMRFLFPVVATVILILLLWVLPKSYSKVGVPFVIERINNHQGNLPIANAIVQFFTAAIGLMGGLSIGKEGPAVHIGATFGSQLARWVRLPLKDVEVLMA